MKQARQQFAKIKKGWIQWEVWHSSQLGCCSSHRGAVRSSALRAAQRFVCLTACVWDKAPWLRIHSVNIPRHKPAHTITRREVEGKIKAGHLPTLPTPLLPAGSSSTASNVYFPHYSWFFFPPASSPLSPSFNISSTLSRPDRGYFNNEDGLTAIESAHKLELQPTSMSNLPSG